MTGMADDIVGLYDRNAGRYDSLRNRSLFEKPWLDRFLDGMPAGGTVLDIGCGMGEPIARHVADCGREMTGIDSSANMIALCRGRMPEQQWLVADMRGLALGRQFAGLIAWDSVFHLSFDDQRAMFSVFAAHALPGAILMFTSGPRHGEAIGTFEGAPLYHASLAPDEYRALLAENHFEVLDYRPEDPGCGGHTIWLARYLAGA